MPDFYRYDVPSVLKEVGSEAETGLSHAQAAERLSKFGHNELPSDDTTPLWKVVLEQFTNVLVIVLIIAAVISFFLGDVEDGIVIMIIVILNAALGTFQEYRAEQALAALSAMQVPNVRVRRENKPEQVPATDLVPGDVVLLQEGDRVPADGRVILSVNLQIEEAALTGESQGVYKNIDTLNEDNLPLGDRKNMAYMGTSVTYGRGEMVVTGTALDTELGKIAKMLMSVEDSQTPLQKRLDQLSKYLVIGAVIIVVIVFLVGLLRGIPLEEMFLTAISLAVAAVPEGLPAVITIALSLGASRMVRRHALIRKLPAVETLGSVTTICTDKTGTLTKNEMTAVLLALPGHDDVRITGVGYSRDGNFRFENDTPLDPSADNEVARFLKAMTLNTDAYLEGADSGELKVVGDTTEGALIVAAEKVGWSREALERDLPRVAELPFSSERKAMTTIHQLLNPDQRYLFTETPYVAITKGAPDRLVSWATKEHTPDGVKPLSDERRQLWQAEIDEMASQGLRVIGVGYRPWQSVPTEITPEIERDLTLIGLVGIVDPARPEVKAAIQIAKSAGVRSIMITGDHALTAEAIGRDLGIIDATQKAVPGTEIDQMSDQQLKEATHKTAVFARVSPEHKMRLVKVLQSEGEVVAMTGDGVNDAPALKQADIGVAMGITGTEVSKGAADMVLTDDNYASIVAAVEEGRLVYDNIRKFVLFLLSSNIGEILVMFVGILIGLPVPLLAIQILWVNLLTDGLPAIALGFEPPEPDLMHRQPRPKAESIFAGGMGTRIIFRSALLAVLTLAAFLYGHAAHNLNPLSHTLGIEYLTTNQLVELAGAAPANWDNLSTEERVSLLEANEENAHEETLTILDAAERLPRTIAFTVLALGQLFHVVAIHAGDKTLLFQVWFKKNMLMLWAVLITAILQFAVIYIPFLQGIFETYPVGLKEMLISVALASLMFWVIEGLKVIDLGRRKAA